MVDAGPASKVKPVYLYVGGAGLGVVAYLYYKRKQAANAAASTATTDTTAASADAIDPATGIPYADENVGSGYSAASSNGSAYGLTPSYYSTVNTSTNTVPTTNAQWAQEALTQLTAQGYDGISVSGALGAYLLNANLSDAQYQIVQAAIALEGYPPVPVPSPHQAPPAGQTNTSPAVPDSNRSQLSEVQVRAASPVTNQIYQKYMSSTGWDKGAWQQAYFQSVNEYKAGGQMTTYQAFASNIAAHEPKK